MIRIPLKVKANLLTQEELVTIASGSSNSIKVKFDIDPNSDFADSTLQKRAIFRYYQGSYFISDVDANGEVYVPKFVIAYPYFKVALRAESENATVVVTTNEIQVPVEKSPVFYETTITDGDVTIRNLDGALNIYKAGDVTLIDFTASYKTAVDAVIAGTYATTSALNLVSSDVDSIKEDVIDMSTSISDLQGDIADLDTTKADKADTYNKTETEALLDGKQNVLVSGENIKTINGTSLLGSGDYAFDSAFNENSTNAVQNKVISKEVKELNYELATLREAVFEVVLSEIDYTSVFTDSFTIPDTLTDTDGTHRVVFSETELKKVAGNSVVMNQYAYSFSANNWRALFSQRINVSFDEQSNKVIVTTIVEGTGGDNYAIKQNPVVPFVANHKYFFVVDYKILQGDSLNPNIEGPFVSVRSFNYYKNNTYYLFGEAATTSSYQIYLKVTGSATKYVGDSWYWQKPSIVDLTQMFGSGNEPTSVDDVRIQWLIKYLESNPDYDAGTIKSSIINGLQSLDSNDEVIGTIAIPSTEIKSAGTAQDYIEVVEGDIVEGEQLYNLVKTTNIGSVDLGTLDYVYELYAENNARFKTTSLANIIQKPTSSANTGNAICGLYLITNHTSLTNNHINMTFSVATSGNLFFINNTYTDAATFKQAMSGVMLDYELTTPTQTTIATNLHFSEISMLIQEGGKIKPLYDNAPVDTTLTFVVKKAISE